MRGSILLLFVLAIYFNVNVTSQAAVGQSHVTTSTPKQEERETSTRRVLKCGLVGVV